MRIDVGDYAALPYGHGQQVSHMIVGRVIAVGVETMLTTRNRYSKRLLVRCLPTLAGVYVYTDL